MNPFDETLIKGLEDKASIQDTFDMLEDAGMGYLVPKEYRRKTNNK